ncbi:hypothetical protein [Saccharopolyspora spinosa]|uniref:Uncharacterized protein n=1 Tax=Saccharopolyspora spinosa TaxID=60894 RepID=A0A2N3YAD4_SACSN|nr:hypothetical protein [Saccharopolyspora spinosa]PKW19811.1 hypothetical protein A8926_8005 [Saccharopolyspora spinosa]
MSSCAPVPVGVDDRRGGVVQPVTIMQMATYRPSMIEMLPMSMCRTPAVAT